MCVYGLCPILKGFYNILIFVCMHVGIYMACICIELRTQPSGGMGPESDLGSNWVARTIPHWSISYFLSYSSFYRRLSCFCLVLFKQNFNSFTWKLEINILSLIFLYVSVNAIAYMGEYHIKGQLCRLGPYFLSC